MSEHRFSTPFGEFELLPLHHHPRSPLQAWNAADEFLLQELAAQPPAPDARVLVVNDHNGALATALHQWHPHSWNDAFTAQLALQQNLNRNGLASTAVDFIAASTPLPVAYDVVLLQLPKTLSLLEYQLLQLRQHIHPKTQIMAGGMIKHMPPSMTALFEKIIGPSRTSLAQKKARLIVSNFNPESNPGAVKSPRYGIDNSPLQLVNHANVFSQQKLDIGTRFLLTHFPDLSAADSILDLGCGNGALGIYAGWKHPAATLHFVDDSFMAIKSAQDSVQLNELKNPVHFYNDDGLTHFSGGVDAILCNPPFHEGNKVHTDIAARMFRDAARHLTANGTLYVVANRHLEYRPLLQPLFQSIRQLQANNKFVILAASGSRRRV